MCFQNVSIDKPSSLPDQTILDEQPNSVEAPSDTRASEAPAVDDDDDWASWE